MTEAAALASARLMGRGDEKAADQAAVDAMRQALNVLDIDGTVVIGEGERDEAPMLYIGEKVGTGTGPKIDIALDPLEGTTITATGGPNAIACIAMAAARRLPERARHLHGQDRRRRRPAARRDRHRPTARPRTSRSLAEAKGLQIGDLVVLILDRPRHQELIAAVRKAGRPHPPDQRRRRRRRDRDRRGPTAASTSTWASAARPRACWRRRRCAASAARCRAGCMFRNDDERVRARRWAITDLDRIYDLDDLAQGDVMFAATGVTDGTMLAGVRRLRRRRLSPNRSSCARKTGTVRIIEAEHYLPVKIDAVPALPG